MKKMFSGKERNGLQIKITSKVHVNWDYRSKTQIFKAKFSVFSSVFFKNLSTPENQIVEGFFFFFAEQMDKQGLILSMRRYPCIVGKHVLNRTISKAAQGYLKVESVAIPSLKTYISLTKCNSPAVPLSFSFHGLHVGYR